MGNGPPHKHLVFQRSVVPYQASASSNILQVTGRSILGNFYRPDALLLDISGTLDCIGKSDYDLTNNRLNSSLTLTTIDSTIQRLSYAP